VSRQRGVAGLVESAHMEAAALLTGIAQSTIVGDPTVEIVRLACHTGDVGPGTLFFCIPGTRTDGHQFAAAAVEMGAVALVCERRLAVEVTQIIVADARRAMALIASRFFGDPSAHLTIAAVTGTNGKTTTAHIVSEIFAAAGCRPALLGTVVNRIGGVESPVTLTTAESIDLQAMFRRMVDAGDLSCAMEVSSHALAMQRTAAIDFDAVIFTNLTRDHLDFHKDLDDYYLAKRRLFLPDDGRQGHAVAAVNVGDDHGGTLAAECRLVYGDDLWSFIVADGGSAATADVTAGELVLGAAGTSFTLDAPRRSVRERVELRLVGRFNVENALAAATATLALGLPLDAVLAGLQNTAGVAGRFDAVRVGQPFTVLVDYSHTPDSLENALIAARGITAGRVLVVFGCGGDRDAGKRPLMGAIGTRLADRAYITSDNPRTEDPQLIIDQILAGVPREYGAHVVVEADRRQAITLALAEATSGDVVLIAGKGHEEGQIIGDRRIPFDDRAVAEDILRGRNGAVD
jgi:UDP-N-acetylmuramoyl-L-alanyl-D-glutamate--2,6-diaminopimelate ligase